jgi:hypothetical protein
MRLLRGLGSQLLPCGCLAGVYETYAGVTVSIIDARGDECVYDDHSPGLVVPTSPTKAAIPVRPAAPPRDGVRLDQDQRWP